MFWHRIYLGGVYEAWRELSAHFAVAAADAASSCSQSQAGFSSVCVLAQCYSILESSCKAEGSHRSGEQQYIILFTLQFKILKN